MKKSRDTHDRAALEDHAMTIHALTDAEFARAAAEAGYVRNDDPCDIPGKPLTPL